MKSKILLTLIAFSVISIESAVACVVPTIDGPSGIWVNTPPNQGTSVRFDIANPEASYGEGTSYYVEWDFPLNEINLGPNGDYVVYYSGENAVSGGGEYSSWTITADVNYTQGPGGAVWNTISDSKVITVANYALINGRSNGDPSSPANTNENETQTPQLPEVLRVYDQQGKTIWKYEGEPFELSKIPTGHYFVKYREGKKIHKKQIMIIN